MPTILTAKEVLGVIFDIDGTLIDTVDMHAEAWQRIFEKFGKKVTFDRVREQIGKGGDELMPVFLSRREIEEFGEQLEKERGELFKSEYLPNAKPFPCTRELFQELAAQGKKLALASSAKGDELQTYKRIARVDDLLHAEASSDDAEKSKPHPDIFLAALQQMGLQAGEAVVVGDTPYDVEAARRADLRTIAVLSGGWQAQDLREAGAVEIWPHVASLLRAMDAEEATA